MADFTRYSNDLAPEWIQFEKTWKRPTPPSAASIEERREMANTRAAEVFASTIGRPTNGLLVSDFDIPTSDGVTIPVRLYKPKENETAVIPQHDEKFPIYITFHGGGFHLGSLETEDPFSRQIALNTGAAVLNVNYRHTPEWKFPAPVDDAWSVFCWIAEHGTSQGLDIERIFVGGVSAGASLALSVARRSLSHMHTSLPRVQGIILGTPSTVHSAHFPTNLLQSGRSSLDINANAPFINTAVLRGFVDLYQPDPKSPDVSPLLLPSSDFNGLCPVSFHIAGLDPLRDEGLLMEEKLRSAGVTTILHVYPGVPHAFMSLPTLPSAQKWRTSMQQDLRKWIE